MSEDHERPEGSDGVEAPSPPPQQPQPRRRRLVAALVDAVAVMTTAARMVAAHWPVLLALALAGRAAREAVMTAAVWASKVDGMVGGLVFVLVPVATLTAQVLMLFVVRGGWAGAATAD